MSAVSRVDLTASVEATGSVLAAVRSQQLGLATPCEAWSVAELLQHLLGSLTGYGTAFGSVEPAPAPSAAPPATADEAATAYTAACTRLLDAVASADPADPVSIPLGTLPAAVAVQLATVEVMVHGWDLACATAQPYECDSDVAERALEFTAVALGRLPADRSPFAQPVPVASSAPAVERLVALLGRNP